MLNLFKNQSAWFSTSVEQRRQDLWVKCGGILVDREIALFLFSEDANAVDTKWIYSSPAYTCDSIAVFHGSYVDACCKEGSMAKVEKGKYYFPPAEYHEMVRQQGGLDLPWVNDSSAVTQCTKTIEMTDSTHHGRTTTSSKDTAPPGNHNASNQPNNAATSGSKSTSTAEQSGPSNPAGNTNPISCTNQASSANISAISTTVDTPIPGTSKQNAREREPTTDIPSAMKRSRREDIENSAARIDIDQYYKSSTSSFPHVKDLPAVEGPLEDFIPGKRFIVRHVKHITFT